MWKFGVPRGGMFFFIYLETPNYIHEKKEITDALSWPNESWASAFAKDEHVNRFYSGRESLTMQSRLWMNDSFALDVND